MADKLKEEFLRALMAEMLAMQAAWEALERLSPHLRFDERDRLGDFLLAGETFTHARMRLCEWMVTPDMEGGAAPGSTMH
jgi:hypothetical protein